MRRLWLLLSLLLVAWSQVSGGVRVVGKAVKLVGGDGNFFMNPVWSPDGQMIAFTGERYEGLWVMKADGSGVRELTAEPAAGYGFEWSADSRAILARVAQYRGPFRYNAAKLFRVDTGEATLLTEYRTSMPELPRWAEGDSKVVIVGPKEVEVVESGKQVAEMAKVSPRYFCYQKGGAIVVAGGGAKPLATLDPLPGEQYLNEVVSPDGRRVAFEVLGGDLYVVNTDGTGLVDLGRGNRPQWAPDSHHLVYMIAEDDGHQFTSSDIYCIGADGSGKTALTSTPERLEMNPCWSPDGSKIAFDTMDEGAIYVLPVAIVDTSKTRIEQ
ncbi:MAG: hypothetical protein QHJ34_13825 [bacterium]|nr:hypothetical protein [candidate division KSB1 bacterium]MDH7561290.1 hypothetical protein [bacterium]